MQKNIEKIAKEFGKVNNFSKSLIKYGTQAALSILTIGTTIYISNHTVLNYDFYTDYVSTLLIKNSFVLLAEIVIGGLLIDYFTRK